jgi:acid phosphatase (class A)
MRFIETSHGSHGLSRRGFVTLAKALLSAARWSMAAVVLSATYAEARQPSWADTIKHEDFVIEAPPRTGSAAHRREIAEILAFQNGDRRAACELGDRQAFPNFELFFGISDLLTDSEKRKLKPIVSKAMNVTQKVSRHFKEQYSRPRPYSSDQRIRPCVVRPPGATSYPSSHASMGYTGACVLAAALPAKAQELMEYGRYVGDLRVIVGVHHTSDVIAGQKLAQEICDRLLANAEFVAELQSANNGSR